jgi:hypothetical protein
MTSVRLITQRTLATNFQFAAVGAGAPTLITAYAMG